jgi:hypothetical protein
MILNADSSSQLICNDDGYGCSYNQSSLDFDAQADTTYIIAVDGWDLAQNGAFELSIAGPAAIYRCPCDAPCDYCHCDDPDLVGNCNAEWEGDGSCDCGCQFNDDVDCS